MGYALLMAEGTGTKGLVETCNASRTFCSGAVQVTSAHSLMSKANHWTKVKFTCGEGTE